MSILLNATVVDSPLNEFLCSFSRLGKVDLVESLAIFLGALILKSKQPKS